MTPQARPEVHADPAASLPPHFQFDQELDQWLGAVREAEAARPLTHIGPYELIAEVSRGGQGAVYFARHKHQPVAIKRMLGGTMAAVHDRHRFEREIEAVTSLNHPRIVKLLSVELDHGQPLFAMPWIDGVKVTRWARSRRHKQSVSRIVSVFIDICDAVQHAHQRGVIHRDLKPSNILVDAHDRPHLLDFGLAKLQVPRDADVSVTQTEQFLGTLAYASPEQLRCRPHEIDARSDIFALGVLLYECLTGKTPFGRFGNVHDALEAMERESAVEPSALNREVDGDLNAIVTKAIAVDPLERYQSVDAFKADLAHWANDEPVLAQGPGTVYLLRKLLRRHRAGVAFALTVALLVIAGGATAVVLAARLAAARDEQMQARQSAEQISTFLRDMLAGADPAKRSDHAELTARELLDQASTRLRNMEETHSDAPRADAPNSDADPTALSAYVRAALHETIGSAYMNLGIFDAADVHLSQSLSLREQLHGPHHIDVINSQGNLATLRYQQRRLDDAAALAAAAVQGSRRLATPPDERNRSIAIALNNLAAIRRAMGNLDEAEPLLRESIELQRSFVADDDPELATTYNNLSNILRIRGNLAEAQEMCQQALDIRRRHYGPRHMLVAQSMANVGTIMYERVNRGEQEQGAIDSSQLPWKPLLVESLALHRELLGPDHPHIAMVAANLGQMMFAQGDIEDAASLLRDALRIRTAVDPDDPQNLMLQVHLGGCMVKMSRVEEARELLTKAHARLLAERGADDKWTQRAAEHLAELGSDE